MLIIKAGRRFCVWKGTCYLRFVAWRTPEKITEKKAAEPEGTCIIHRHQISRRDETLWFCWGGGRVSSFGVEKHIYLSIHVQITNWAVTLLLQHKQYWQTVVDKFSHLITDKMFCHSLIYISNYKISKSSSWSFTCNHQLLVVLPYIQNMLCTVITKPVEHYHDRFLKPFRSLSQYFLIYKKQHF